MKRKIVAIIFSVFLSTTIWSQTTNNLDHYKCFVLNFKASNEKITLKEWNNYAHDYHYETFEKYRNDEFEWMDKLSIIKKDFIKDIANISITDDFSIFSSFKFNEYDFEHLGFPLEVAEGYSYEFSPDRFIHKSKSFRVFFSNITDFNFLPIDKNIARQLIIDKKDKDGEIKRYITVKINMKMIPFEEEIYSLTNKKFGRSSYKILLFKITEIKFFDDSNQLIGYIKNPYL